MRLQRTLALLGVGILWLALGPFVLPVAAGTLLLPRVRTWLRPTRRVTAIVAAALLTVAGLVVLVPDGWLPVPPGPGALVAPRYTGRPAAVRPLRIDVPQHPHLAPAGASGTNGDAWATGTTPWRGPVGESPRVDSSWFGLEECGHLAVDSRDRLVGLCEGRHGPKLRVLDPESMNPTATKELPDRADGQEGCASDLYLDDRDRAVLATTDGRVLVVATSDADGAPDLTTDASYDLSGRLAASDCVVGLRPGWDGVLWWVTRAGRVGTLAPDTGRVRTLDLKEDVASPPTVDRDGVYVVTTYALYRLAADPTGRPAVTWRASYDRGSERKSGQPTQGSGTPATLLPGGLVAIADNAEPRMHVVFHDTGTGRQVCEAPVFGDDEGATASGLVSVGTGVIVENNHGYDGPLSTTLGLTSDGGLARVDVTEGACSVRWTSEEVAPSTTPTLSRADGLLYAYTKPHSWWGADAWYLAAIDARSGRTAFEVRTGIGTLMDGHHSAVTLARDGSAYVPVLSGLVRVRDRQG
jgi:hypothetical protein